METDERYCTEFWQDARAKAETFGPLDTAGMVFGAGPSRGFGHRHEILPVVSDRDILVFETNNGFELPVQYRTYLQTFGAGGAGPYYGVFDYRKHVMEETFPEPFPYTEEVWYDDVADDDPLYDLPGLARIIEAGCGAGYLVELNGANPGQLWCDWNEACSNGDTLISLYAKWLDKVGTGLERYHLLRSFIDDNGKIPKMVLQDVADRMQCTFRETRFDDTPEDETWVYFDQTPGRVLINDKKQVLKIEAGGQIS